MDGSIPKSAGPMLFHVVHLVRRRKFMASGLAGLKSDKLGIAPTHKQLDDIYSEPGRALLYDTCYSLLIK